MTIDRLAYLLSDPDGRCRTAVLEEDTELVTTQTGHRVAGPHAPAEQDAEFPQQLISCQMATDIVDPLESVQVEEADSMLAPLLRRALERLGEAALELGAVHQVGQSVVCRLMRQLPSHLSRTGDVPSDEDDSCDGPLRIPDRCGRDVEHSTTGCGAVQQPSLEWPEGRVRAAAPLVQEKIGRFGEFPGFAGFLFHDVEPDPALLDQRILGFAETALTAVDPWAADGIETALKKLCDELGEKPRTVYLPIRVAVTGSRVSPGLYESLELLGKDVSLERLHSAAAVSPA